MRIPCLHALGAWKEAHVDGVENTSKARAEQPEGRHLHVPIDRVRDRNLCDRIPDHHAAPEPAPAIVPFAPGGKLCVAPFDRVGGKAVESSLREQGREPHALVMLRSRVPTKAYVSV